MDTNSKETKRLVLGDVHTHFDTVNKIYEKEQPDSVIILGDYFDSFARPSHIVQREGFEKLLEMKKKHEESGKGKFTLLLGNHDFHYSKFCAQGYSGFSLYLKKEVGELINSLIIDGTLPVVFIDEKNKTIYSHAGVTEYWFKNVLEGESLNDINDVENMDLLDFNFEIGYNPYGDTISQSPIWVRPSSLISNHISGWNQVVGHTHVREPLITELSEDTKLYVMDTMPNYYIVETLDENGKLIERKIIDNREDEQHN